MDYILLLAVIIPCFVLLLLGKQYISYLEKRQILEFKKIKVKKQVELREDELAENEDTTYQDEQIESIVPSWVLPILEGANIDIEKASKGDKGEIEKLANVLLNFVGKKSESNDLILQ